MVSVGLSSSPQLGERLMVRQLTVVVLMHLAALVALFYPSWTGLGYLLLGHFFTGCLGGSIGLHRLLSHRSFHARPFLRGTLALAGTLSFMGGPITWAAFHRAHHSMQDEAGDPHAATRGFFWSHIGWVFFSAPNGFTLVKNRRLVSDLTTSKWLCFLEDHHLAINLVAMALGFALISSWEVFLWAFPLRIVTLWHCTWLVNSYAHNATFKPGQKETSPQNSMWLAIFTYGEGYHKNHHIRPADPRFAHKIHQPDMAYWVICLFSAMGLVQSREKKRSMKVVG